MKFYKQLLTLICLLLFISLASVEAKPKIIGGETASGKNYPWMVALVSKKAKSSYWGQFCAGALLKPRWVVTAAHCVDNDQAIWGFDVVAGRANLKKVTGQRVAPSWMEIAGGVGRGATWREFILLNQSMPQLSHLEQNAPRTKVS